MKHSLRLRSLFVMGASTAVIAAATPALAQQATMLEELVVTAERRDQSLQDVPVAVTAYTSERRDVLGVATVEDLARVSPSVAYTNNDRLSIRGFGRLTNAIGTDPSVALYSDGIFSNTMADSSTPSLFIERTEILRGPQGTLYGRNSIGGALNIIGKRPSFEFEGEVRATVGNYGTWQTDALISGPVTEGLRFLVGGSVQRREEGFIENIGPAGDTSAVKRWIFEAQVEADLGETRAVEACQHGHRDQQGPGRRRGHRVPRRDQHVASPARMHVDHPRAQRGGGAAGAGNGVRDVVEFQVQENRQAQLVEAGDDRRPLRGEKFLADLHSAAAAAQAAGDRQRFGAGGIVQCDDDRHAWIRIAHVHSPSMPWMGLTVLHDLHPGHCQCSERPAKPQLPHLWVALPAISRKAVSFRIVRSSRAPPSARSSA